MSSWNSIHLFHSLWQQLYVFLVLDSGKSIGVFVKNDGSEMRKHFGKPRLNLAITPEANLWARNHIGFVNYNRKLQRQSAKTNIYLIHVGW